MAWHLKRGQVFLSRVSDCAHCPLKKGCLPASRVNKEVVIPHDYKAHTSIDRCYRLIRCWDVTDASRHDGRLLRQRLLDPTNTGAGVWADTAYRSQQNVTFLERHGFISHIHRQRRPGRPLPPHIRRGNATRPRDRASVEHVFAVQKQPWGWSSEPSVSPEPARRSVWPTSPSASGAWSNFGAALPLDQPTARLLRPSHLPRAFNPPFHSDSHSNLRHPRHYSRFSASSHPPPSVMWGSQLVEPTMERC